MKKKIVVLALFAVGCTTIASNSVTLSKDEKTKAQSIAERRQQIGFERAAAQNEFQSKLNHLAEQEGSLNLEAAKLCYEFKKSHKLAPNTNYTLDEWNGQLVKQ